MRRQQRQKTLELGVILLLTELFNIGFDAIPPITLFTIIGQALLYVGIVELPWEPWEICISADKVWKQRDFKPLLWANFVHGDDMHLYYNMVSFLVKGRTLESRYGSANFAFLLGFLTVMTSGLYVGLSIMGAELMGDKRILSSCAVGFSGVIFALKLITTIENPKGYTRVGDFNVPTRYAAWAELIAIYVLVPNSSFLGHFAGILAGLLYMKTPLQNIIDGLISSITGRNIYHPQISSEDYAEYYYENYYR
ncbi:rhomboid-related protein 4-like [Cimex lectularius]|uniref:Peptidase S54 rhomboid domain-containing protein n=1 Tax=Cimex lectularius TaxID=79782 RepID=A0A8I6S354_CIMLE|nr:rhomboid-related protein 4-like [Cimex lectularius]